MQHRYAWTYEIDEQVRKLQEQVAECTELENQIYHSPSLPPSHFCHSPDPPFPFPCCYREMLFAGPALSDGWGRGGWVRNMLGEFIRRGVETSRKLIPLAWNRWTRCSRVLICNG